VVVEHIPWSDGKRPLTTAMVPLLWVFVSQHKPWQGSTDPTIPMGSMKTAWTACHKAAGVWCRLHDLRHTFISALGEAGVPESTMKAIAGRMSAEMLERYSHTRQQAKRDQVNKLPRRRPV
jgi:integrase